MSRQRVVTGVGDRGRPKAEWAPASTALGYGFMEPAFAGTIERRTATPEELAAARARESAPSHLTVAGGGLAKPATGPHFATAEHMQQSRMRGAARHVEVVAAARERPLAPVLAVPADPAIEEETVMTELPIIVTSEDAEAHAAARAVPNPLSALAVAAERAALAKDEYEMAQAAWDVARESLARAYAEIEWLVEPMPAPEHVAFAEPPPEPDPEIEAAKANIIRTLREAAAAADKLPSTDDVNPEPIGGGPAPRRNVREPRTEGLTTRQAKAIELMQGGRSRADIARDMGTTYQTVDGLFEAAAKKGLLPIELIPLLPARFAKYTGV